MTAAAGEKGVAAMRLSSDGRRIVAAGSDGKVRLWDSTAQSTDPVPSRATLEHAAPVHSLALNADGRRVASAGEEIEVPAS